MSLSPSRSSKKRSRDPCEARSATCLADGCNSDLRIYKEYHRRHRVCEEHSKSPVVIIRGEKKRFCQQCSKFHSILEFDEVKRSCRKRLDGHNRRRRKLLPGNFRGPRLLQFDIPGTTCSSQDQKLPGQPNAFTWTYHEKGNHKLQRGSQVSGTQDSFQVSGTQDSFFLQHMSSVICSQNETCSSESDKNAQSVDSNPALCLLSTNPAQPSYIGLNHMVKSHMVNPLLPLDSTMEDESLVFSGVNGSNMGCNGMFHMMMPDDFTETGSSPTLPILYQ